MCVWVCACMYVSVSHVCLAPREIRRLWSFGIKVKNDCEQYCGCWELNLDPPQGQKTSHCCFLVLWDRVSLQTLAGLELNLWLRLASKLAVILLPLSPKCWDYRRTPLCQVSRVPNLEFLAGYTDTLPTKLHPSPQVVCFFYIHKHTPCHQAKSHQRLHIK